MIDTSKVVGAVTEHWMDKRMRLHLPINDESNVPRISAETLVKLNDYRNSMLGTDYTLYEVDRMAGETEK